MAVLVTALKNSLNKYQNLNNPFFYLSPRNSGRETIPIYGEILSSIHIGIAGGSLYVRSFVINGRGR